MATTLAQLRTRARQRCDNEYADGEFVTDTEVDALINVSYKHLFAMLVESGLDTVTETVYDLTPNGDLTYPLPDDCYSIKGVFRQDNDSYIPLTRHSSRTYPRDETTSWAFSYRQHGRLEDAVIELNPRTNTGTYKIRYVGVPADLALDADTVQGIVGWEEWIVLDVAVKVLEKEKQWESADRLLKRLGMLEYKIRGEASDRDLHNAGEVQDVKRRDANGLFDEAGYLPGGWRGVRGYRGSF
jgi:hypothetical protein